MVPRPSQKLGGDSPVVSTPTKIKYKFNHMFISFWHPPLTSQFSMVSSTHEFLTFDIRVNHNLEYLGVAH